MENNMQTTDHVLVSDIENALWLMKKVRELPISLQEVFHEMCDIYLSDTADQDEKEAAYYTILEIWDV